jgi:hypothetical protein
MGALRDCLPVQPVSGAFLFSIDIRSAEELAAVRTFEIGDIDERKVLEPGKDLRGMDAVEIKTKQTSRPVFLIYEDRLAAFPAHDVEKLRLSAAS